MRIPGCILPLSALVSTIGALLSLGCDAGGRSTAQPCCQAQPDRPPTRALAAPEFYLSGTVTPLLGEYVLVELGSDELPGVPILAGTSVPIFPPVAALRIETYAGGKRYRGYFGGDNQLGAPLASATFRSAGDAAMAVLAHGWLFGDDAWTQLETDNVVIGGIFLGPLRQRGVIAFVGAADEPHYVLNVSSESFNVGHKRLPDPVALAGGSFLTASRDAISAPAPIADNATARRIQNLVFNVAAAKRLRSSADPP